MPEVELEEETNLGVDDTFAVMFGAELFKKFHAEQGHLSCKSEEWVYECGSLRRNLEYNLPANPYLRMPIISVRSSEVATKEKDGTWTLVGNAANEGSEMAKATHCSARYSITPSGVGSKITCLVNYSFELSSIPWVFQKTIELAMHREMKEGHRKFLTATKKAIQEGMRSPLPVFQQRELNEISFHSKPSSCANSSIVGGSFQRDGFFTPLATPNHIPEEQVTPIASEIAPLDWSVDRDVVKAEPTTTTTTTTTATVHHHGIGEQQLHPRKTEAAGESYIPKSHRRDRRSGSPVAMVSVDIPPIREHGHHQGPDSPKSRSHPRKYRKLTLLILALAASWCLGHLSAVMQK